MTTFETKYRRNKTSPLPGPGSREFAELANLTMASPPPNSKQKCLAGTETQRINDEEAGGFSTLDSLPTPVDIVGEESISTQCDTSVDNVAPGDGSVSSIDSTSSVKPP